MARENVDSYLENLANILGNVLQSDIELLASEIYDIAVAGGWIFVAGNGGSAATADHWANDLSKLTMVNDRSWIRALSLTQQVSVFTAWANDASYEQAFSQVLRHYRSSHTSDLVVALTTSGQSSNIIHLLQESRHLGIKSIVITGNHQNRAAEWADRTVTLPTRDTQFLEDIHLILGHVVSKSLRRRWAQTVESAHQAGSDTP